MSDMELIAIGFANTIGRRCDYKHPQIDILLCDASDCDDPPPVWQLRWSTKRVGTFGSEFHHEYIGRWGVGLPVLTDRARAVLLAYAESRSLPA